MVIGAQEAQGGEPAPPELLDALSERWHLLAASASGRVFELPADSVERAVLSECSRGARYDTILSFMRTPRVFDLDSFVSALERILADDGWILMIEPSTSGPGRLRGRLPSWLGHHRPSRDRHERDVVSAVRSAGLVVTDLHRREVPSVEPAWRQYVVLRARRESPRSPES